jgi:hypothetical protein
VRRPTQEAWKDQGDRAADDHPGWVGHVQAQSLSEKSPGS